MAGAVSMLGDEPVTGRLVKLGRGNADVLAFIGSEGLGLAEPVAWSYAELTAVIEAAAAGLAWHGLQRGDVVGVQVGDTASYILARHAIRAAGGVPTPVAPDLPVSEVAGQLAESDARMMITTPDLAQAAVAAADRSWVRQVFSFGEAAGTTPFDSLLALGSLEPVQVRRYEPGLLPFSRSPEGRLRPSPVTQMGLADRLVALAARWGLLPRDVVLVDGPAGDGLRFTLGLDCALLSGATVIAARTRDLAGAAIAQDATAVIALGGRPERLPAEVRLLEFD